MALTAENSWAAIPGTVRDASTGIILVINANGSINITYGGVKSTDTSSSIDNNRTIIPGTIRDGNTGRNMFVNADGSINVATS